MKQTCSASYPCFLLFHLESQERLEELKKIVFKVWSVLRDDLKQHGTAKIFDHNYVSTVLSRCSSISHWI